MKNNVISITTSEQFNTLINANTSIVNFWADWHEPCVHLNSVFVELSTKFPKITFIDIQPENFEDIAEQFEIETVPTFIVLVQGKQLEKLEGADPSALSNLCAKYAKHVQPAPTSVQQAPVVDLKKKLHTLVNSQPIMLFMKGSPSAPKCGFSRQVVDILSGLNCTYGSFDILADDTVRQGLKEYSDWPTYPQIYVNGELIGGLDILKELVESGEFQKMIPAEDDLNTILKKLVNKAPVMLFMKGNPDVPKCGFSRTIAGILKDQGVVFETFDILEDDEVRQGLKVFSDWPTFPQLYIKGELIGGLDIVKEMIANGEFQDVLPK
ncbi:thioredoxin-like protein [Globomyces pollinis-pini]|nr:thioredoxin-like protein [Globomyces pollinis-pini]